MRTDGPQRIYVVGWESYNTNWDKSVHITYASDRRETGQLHSPIHPRLWAMCHQRKITAERLNANQLREPLPAPQLQQNCSSETLLQ